MKRLLLYCFILLVSISSQATAQKKNKMQFEFPKEMAADVQAAYLRMCEQGYLLYQLNCSGCHSEKKGRKETVPDFTVDQLEAYKIRVMNPTHEDRLPETTLTSEELSLIVTFFTYKRPQHR